MDLKDFDDIRPYSDEELHSVLNRLVLNEQFCSFAEKAIGAENLSKIKQCYDRIPTIQEFQVLAINPFLDMILNRLSTSFESQGVEQSLSDNGCTYISNHRDIVIDVALLDKILLDHKRQTVEIGIGNNLLIYPWIEDLVRINRAFIVRRDGKGRELLFHSKHMSDYIHYTITQQHHSIWIAQRQGRAKDSDDRTQESLIKMLAMGSDKPFTESLKEINLRPLTISYEYDPCDYLKAQEFQQHRDNPDFKKSQADDLINMQVGIMGFKGQIYYHCSDNLNSQIDEIAATESNRNQQAVLIAQAIDRQIHAHYRIYPINYIALDMMSSQNRFTNKYTSDEYTQFKQYIAHQLEKIQLPNKDEQCLTEYILKIYANPLINHLATQQ